MNILKLARIGDRTINSPFVCSAIFNPQRSRLHKLKLVLLVLGWMLVSSSIYAQGNRLFAVKSIISDVKSQLRLNTQDLRLVGPLIEQENRDVLVIFARFDDDEPEYSPALWRDIVDRRLEFEKRLHSNLTHRQMAALRIARAALERRILGILVDDYIYFLVDTLELNELQTEGVDYLLRGDCRKKHRSIINHYASPSSLQVEIKMIDEETEDKMKAILSPVQLRIYHSLYSTDCDLVG